MTFDPIGTIVGHTYNAQGQKVAYAKRDGSTYRKAEQLGEEFISFLKNDTNAAADQLLSKQEATDGFKAFLKAKYNASDDCIAQFLPDFQKDLDVSFDAWQKAEPASIENGNIKFSSLVNNFDNGNRAEYVQYPSFQFFADDAVDDSKDGVFQKIVNLSTTQNSLCEAAPTTITPPTAPAPEETGEAGKTIVTTTTTAAGSGIFGRLGSLGSKWLLVLGAVGLGFLLQGRNNAPYA